MSLTRSVAQSSGIAYQPPKQSTNRLSDSVRPSTNFGFRDLLSTATKRPTTNTYSSYAEPFLARRLLHMYVLICIWIMFSSYIVFRLFLHNPGVFSLIYQVYTFVGAIGIIVAHKTFLTTKSETYPSTIVSVWKRFTTKRAVALLAAYVASGVLSAYSFINHVPLSSNESLSAFLHVANHSDSFFNEKFCFFITAGAFAGFLHTLGCLLTRPDHIEFPQQALVPIWQRIISMEGLVVYRSAILGTLILTMLTWAPFYYIFGGWIYRLWTYLVGLMLPWSSVALSHNPKVGWENWSRCASMMLLLGLVWGVTDYFVRVYFSQPVVVSELAPDMYACITDGMRSKNDYMKSLAFYEAARLSEQTDPKWDWRKNLYKDVSKERNTWKAISRESMDVIAKATYRFKNFGKEYVPTVNDSASTTSAPSVNASWSDSMDGDGETNSMIKKIAVAPGGVMSHRHVSDVFKGTDTSLTKTGQARSSQSSSLSRVELPSIFGPLEAKVKQIAKSAPVSKVPKPKSLVEGLIHRVQTYVIEALRKDTLGRAFTANTIERKAMVLAADASLQLQAINALANLTVYSLNEDVYGTVQKDIPTVIEVLTRYLVHLEYWLENMPVERDDDHGQTAAGRAEVVELLSPLKHGVESALMDIVKTFWEFMEEFTLPPDVQRRLQQWIDTGA